jgi:hypothetical protein
MVCDTSGVENPLKLLIEGLGVGPLVQLQYDTISVNLCLICDIIMFVDTGEVLLRTAYEYKFVMANRGEIDAHFSLVASPSVSMELAKLEMDKKYPPPLFDVIGKSGHMNQNQKKQSNDDNNNKQSNIITPETTVISYIPKALRVEEDAGSLAVRPPPTTSEVMKATRPPLVFTPEAGIIPPHQQVNLNVSFFPERCV